MGVQPKHPKNVWEYHGLTFKQYSSQPLYVQDALASSYREVLRLQRKLDRAEGIKPVERRVSYDMTNVVVVSTDDGDYAFPFKDRGSYRRAEVTLQLPTPPGRIRRKVSMIFNEDHGENQVEIYSHGGHGLTISPRASNTFTLKLTD